MISPMEDGTSSNVAFETDNDMTSITLEHEDPVIIYGRREWQFPFMLSCLAGASTSVGAAIVFVLSPTKIRQSMSFSLSLAASVMITVSVISLGPECLEGVIEFDDSTNKNISKFSMVLLLQRIVSFAMGCFSYYFLSRLMVALPDPESFIVTSSISTSPTTTTTASSSSSTQLSLVGNKNNDDDERQQLPLYRETFSSPNDYYHRGAVRRAVAKDATQYTQHSISPRNSGGSSISDGTDNLNIGDDYSFDSVDNYCNDKLDDEDNDNYNYKNWRSNPTLNFHKNGNNRNSPLSRKRPQKHQYQYQQQEERRRSWRVAMLLFVSLLCHNFPEGLAVVASTIESRQLGVTVAIGIFIHNIPEGIAIAVPCMAARPDAPWLAFGLASISGLAEPMGALLALTVLRLNENRFMENILAIVAGIMCTVAIMELYPEAYRHVQHKNYSGLIGGTITGMVIMITTEWYLP